MTVKQGASFAIIGCALWAVVQLLSIVGSITTMMNSDFDMLVTYTLKLNILQNFGRVLVATSFLIFFIYAYIGKQNKSVSLIALVGSILWILLNTVSIFSSYLEQITYSSMAPLAYIGLASNLLMIIVSIILLIFFILYYSNNKEHQNSSIQIIGIAGSAIWLIAYALMQVQNYMIYSEYSIPMFPLLFNFISWVAPISFLAYFSAQASAIREK